MNIYKIKAYNADISNYILFFFFICFYCMRLQACLTLNSLKIELQIQLNVMQLAIAFKLKEQILVN